MNDATSYIIATGFCRPTAATRPPATWLFSVKKREHQVFAPVQRRRHLRDYGRTVGLTECVLYESLTKGRQQSPLARGARAASGRAAGPRAKSNKRSFALVKHRIVRSQLLYQSNYNKNRLGQNTSASAVGSTAKRRAAARINFFILHRLISLSPVALTATLCSITALPFIANSIFIYVDSDSGPTFDRDSTLKSDSCIAFRSDSSHAINSTLNLAPGQRKTRPGGRRRRERHGQAALQEEVNAVLTPSRLQGSRERHTLEGGAGDKN
ncbi:hypothetical protein EVAR_86012_1 [Eumeta japonica]|uniref:Uncharacterized protein n=1 Tax=Eumeta variegata TaxID=151549 RepID=A0A4C1UK15_EUMVA|nr:hypothetical protein EVAR_86012_1 [Eumeta japonica]